ncbi:Fumarylacetoacetate hydrolase domain-containing protein 2 [Colletotrichum orbiculare MAFF 240422]|uniref:Fumarylacetoacetate hydrolase domain-containing protein 2 n=1 Tax=Colletotrichum orbiculare (strain 104-T / ATCC 96160 / CBS 514.97 / LARS 414 / MAFF 240422) TaxID=1213857 RepID=N4URZ7_COLOR|nr:Fumarylacetoacetate hydrolase domain-containing protein 2 [Colletotrichum orbiculare MAFF 240422]
MAPTSLPSFKRLVRFVPRDDANKILIGEPESDSVDVGAALRDGKEVKAVVWSGSSVLSPGEKTEQRAVIDRVLSPVSAEEVGTIRCIGLNYVQHAKEVGVALPDVPTVFLKPSTSLGNPWPEPTVLPLLTQVDDCGDYESELAVVLGKTAKNVSEANALDYVLGYTACNDVSSRTYQLNQSQWCFAKGFDGSCPLGPTLVSKDLIPDPTKLTMRGLRNGDVLQESGINDLIFSIPKLISFLSQSTTLPAGTVIITGTPAGVGLGRKPKVTLKDGDEFRVEILPHIGTLVNVFQNEGVTAVGH